MEEVQKFCKSVYWFIFKSKDKAEWIQVLQWIDKIEQNHIWTEHHEHWVGVHNYIKERYNINFK